MANFFPISRGDLAFIVILLVFVFVSFLPWSRSIGNLKHLGQV